MSWLLGMGSGGSGRKPPNQMIATSGRWLATCIAGFATVFWTPDVWMYLDDSIFNALRVRYDETVTVFVYWSLWLASYPLMYFSVRMGLGLAFVTLVMGALTRMFGGRK